MLILNIIFLIIILTAAYTYNIHIPLLYDGPTMLHYHKSLTIHSSNEYAALANKVHNGLDRMVMQSNLRDVYHGVHVTSFSNITADEKLEIKFGILIDFYLQLSENHDEQMLINLFKKYLQNNNYNLGGTDLYTNASFISKITAAGKYKHYYYTYSYTRSYRPPDSYFS